jgi:hypothetical protein
MGDFQFQRSTAKYFELLARLYGSLPFLLLLKDSAQLFQCFHLVSRALRKPYEKLLCPIQQPGSQIILRKRKQCLVALIGRQIRPGNDVLMNADRAIDFPSSSEKAAKCKVRFDRPIVYPDHFQKMFQCLIRLLVQQKIEALQVVDVGRGRMFFNISFTKAA